MNTTELICISAQLFQANHHPPCVLHAIQVQLPEELPALPGCQLLCLSQHASTQSMATSRKGTCQLLGSLQPSAIFQILAAAITGEGY